jgi:hypothetical protein
MTYRIDSLVADNYTVKSFADLPHHYQMALVWFMSIDGDAWDGVDITSSTNDDVKKEITELMPKYIELYGKTEFKIATLNVQTIQNSIMCDEEISESFSNWDEYHKWYLSGATPKHPQNNRWPLILSNDDSETIRDDWHRFHSYVRDGATEIDVIL